MKPMRSAGTFLNCLSIAKTRSSGLLSLILLQVGLGNRRGLFIEMHTL